MDRLLELILVAGIIVMGMYAMKISEDSIQQVSYMNQQIHMMFIKS